MQGEILESDGRHSLKDWLLSLTNQLVTMQIRLSNIALRHYCLRKSFTYILYMYNVHSSEPVINMATTVHLSYTVYVIST